MILAQVVPVPAVAIAKARTRSATQTTPIFKATLHRRLILPVLRVARAGALGHQVLQARGTLRESEKLWR